MRFALALFLAFELCPVAPLAARDLHYSFWSDNPQIFPEAVSEEASPAFLNPLPAGNARAGILPHHFLARSLIADFFRCLRARSSPNTVVLIAPNHFHQGFQRISLSSLPWKTPFGILNVDLSRVEELKESLSLPEDQEAFSGEHSVGVLIPFVKYYFPESRIVPVLLEAETGGRLAESLAMRLREFLADPTTVVLLSMDFSHDSTLPIADQRDKEAEQAILGLDYRQATELKVDCRNGLRALLLALNGLPNIRTAIRSHANSARITGRMDQPDITSYFTVLFFRSTEDSDQR